MMKLRSKKFSRSSSSKTNKSDINSNNNNGGGCNMNGEIKWELRPGGMLVQKRESSSSGSSSGEGMITVRVSTTVTKWHDIPIEATSTFGELKMVLSLVTGLEPREQRLLYKGKERDDSEHLHMVGVRDKDKVLLLEDPATKESKRLHEISGSPFRTISV